MTVPSELSGSYHPRTDHLRFNQRIPNEFPFIEYGVHHPGEVAGRAVLIEEFLHRCQWAGTPFGLVFRAAALVQVRETLHILRRLAADRSLRLVTPWFDVDGTFNDESLADSLRTLKALELLQRFLLGVSLGRPVSELAGAVDVSREALTRSSPLSFGTFRSWSAHDVIYRSDGSPMQNRSTRGILESHASAYAVELLRSCSPRAEPAWFDDHTRRNRVGLYAALEELARATETSVPLLGIRHILDLADLSISVQVADIYGFPPPTDYVDSVLPYVRYATALQDIAGMTEAFAFLAESEPEKYADLDNAQRLDLIVRGAVTLRGQASPLLQFPVMSRRPSMERNIAATWQWDAEERRHLDSSGDVRMLEEMLIDALTYSSIRFFKIHAEMSTDSTLFEPTVDRFILLARACDWPVVEYADSLEVFLCDPMADPRFVVSEQITIFELSRMARRLLTEACSAVDGPSWVLSIRQKPLVDMIGVSAEQLRATP